MNRREVVAAMAAVASLAGLSLSGLVAEAQGTDSLNVAKVYHYDDLPETHYANGGWGKPVFAGTLPTGEYVAMHLTMLPAGKMPHPPHKHRDTEIIILREGKVEFLNDGVVDPRPIVPGDVVYVASEVMHGWTNIGDTPALYFVIEISRKDPAEKA
jgi:quercetin dioxygenase-like cupin family protein